MQMSAPFGRVRNETDTPRRITFTQVVQRRSERENKRERAFLTSLTPLATHCCADSNGFSPADNPLIYTCGCVGVCTRVSSVPTKQPDRHTCATSLLHVISNVHPFGLSRQHPQVKPELFFSLSSSFTALSHGNV